MNLKLKKFTSSSSNEFRAFYQSEEMMRYIGDGKVYTDLDCEKGIQKLLKRYKPGSNQGHWAVYDESKYIGKALLLPWDNKVDFELGYGVLPAYWKMGYGTAMAEIMLALAKQDGHQKLIATVHRKNKGSIKILRKLGFSYSKKVKKYGREKDLYVWLA